MVYPNANERTLALAYYQRAAAQYSTLFPGKKDYHVGSMLYHEGQIYSAERKLPKAELVLQEAVQIDTARLPAEDQRLHDAQSLLKQVLAAEHRPNRLLDTEKANSKHLNSR